MNRKIKFGGDSDNEILKESDIEIDVYEYCKCRDELFDLNYFEHGYVKNLVLVNFHYLGKYAFTHPYGYETEIRQIKYDIANRIKIPEENLQIMHWHVFLPDSTTLEYIPTECKSFMDLTIVNLSSETPCNIGKTVVPDIITVHFQDDNEYRQITVEIEDRKIVKPYLGGYRNKKSGIEYHHAFSQSGPPEPKVSPEWKNTRDTQTIDVRHRRTDMTYDCSTQMSNELIWIPTLSDKILTAKTYETAEEREERLGVLRAILVIQRYFRRWKLNKALKVLSAEYWKRIRDEENENLELLRDFEKQKKREILNKVFPRTRSDFCMLYAMVDRWKKGHIERISKMHTTASKLAEFYLLLQKEIEMLSVIEKQRHKLKQEMKVVDEIRFFHTISDPLRWVGYKGVPIVMDTLETQKGRTFKETYYKACNRELSIDERIQFLDELIGKLNAHNCQVGNEIITLVKREKELLRRNLDTTKLDILRKRIQALLLKHYKMPQCNEGVTKRMLKLKEKDMENNLFFCLRCETLKPYKEFPLNHRNNKFIACTICHWHDRTAEPWIDIAPYRFILRCIRRDERKRSWPSSIVFIMQERDIHYLVERIWHSQSLISECKDVMKLRFVRWDVRQEWSPWNCILLTEEEAASHVKIKKLEDVYDEEIRQVIVSKHMFARCVFANVLLLENSLRLLEDDRERSTPVVNEDDLNFMTDPDACELTQYTSEETVCEKFQFITCTHSEDEEMICCCKKPNTNIVNCQLIEQK